MITLFKYPYDYIILYPYDYLGETIQHELKCATIGFMFITIIRHIKSLQKKQMHHTSTKWVL